VQKKFQLFVVSKNEVKEIQRLAVSSIDSVLFLPHLQLQVPPLPSLGVCTAELILIVSLFFQTAHHRWKVKKKHPWQCITES